MKYINLDNVCEFVRNGASIKQDSQCNEGIPITRIETISNDKFNFDRLGYANIKDDKYSDYYLKDKDVLLSHINSAKYLGRSVLYRKKDENPIIHGMNLLCLRFIKDKYLPDYFVYYSQSKVAKAYIQKHTKLAVNQASITSTAIKDMPIPMIEMEKQKEISKALDKCNEIIHKHKQLLSKYDFLIKSRFIEMFGDPHNNTKYPYKNVGEFTTVTSGGTPDRKNNEYWKNGKIPWVKTTELQNNELTEVEEFITKKGLDESSAKMMPKGTLLIAMYGQGKTRGMTAYLGIEASTNQACACILPSKKINQRYLWYYFILSYDKLRDLAKGGNQPNLNGNMIKSFPVLIPPIDMQNKYVSFIQQIDKSKFAVQKSLEKAETLYKSLMQEYFG